MDLKDIRSEIDVIDKELVDLFEKRMKLCRDVAEFKFKTGKAVLDRERENEK
ncbi:MAG TPA: bifunctional chorismate mutase/prephenate dehydratase, partial [Eubacterium sp.]|nr:bifunctional chorismate mutase/prephenate dehydratase [Eubacterium sp.]